MPDEALETPRLVLRRFREDDWSDLLEYLSTPEVTRFETPYPEGEPGAKSMASFFAGSQEFWAVCLRDGGKVIGQIHLGLKEPAKLGTYNLGFVFNPAYHGLGYATEACRRILAYGFGELGIRRVEAGCHPDNLASWRLLARLGLRREAHHLKNSVIHHTPEGEPIYWDSFEYAMLREEWVG